ncbi:MAG: arylsulfatase, partial [Betaproteobacteria bacterium]
PSAVRYKNWKFYYAMAPSSATGGLLGVQTYHWTQVNNIKRDPFEAAVGAEQLTLLGMGGSLAAPSTAYLYDWNLLPIGQLLWMKELMSYKQFPALQSPSSYNLDQIIKEMQESHVNGHLGS